MTEILLLAAGLVAGAINTLAGGGSFILFPALLAAGVPPVLANASNTYASLPGYASGAIGFWPQIRAERRRLTLYTLIALVFGFLGAELLLRVSDAEFALIVPWLIGFAVTLFAFGGRINAWMARRAAGSLSMQRAGTIVLAGLLALVCLYGGFFNAGLGILLLAFLALAGLRDIHAMNGLKLWMSAIVALVAVARFASEGAIAWYEGSIALIGITIGGYGAARLAHLVPTGVLRGLIIVYGVGLTAYFFWTTYD
ncbi:sulfite exporter TauE/SafE family protein [Arsenicitalea aurantiaca]|uniref:Probable membrane transporter protein n=1 Tax=Arsenicitalea aurantiaca TaxID=1783274 RepID=A0A433X3I4_9HYPH|nr:sulfite exporter TauE/SafE family protein [Arsenicitalea aurantiaca]